MTQSLTGYERYAADFEALEGMEPPNGSAWLRGVRREALAAFRRLGFPAERRGNERWKYTNVAPIARSTFAYPFDVDMDAVTEAFLRQQGPWSDDWARLVFVDGRFSALLSTTFDGDDGLRLVNIGAALHKDGGGVRQHLGKLAQSGDGFTAVNTAFLGDGALVEAPDDTACERPVHLVFVSSGASPDRVSYPRALVLAGRNSRLTLVESYVGPGDGRYFTNAVTEIVAQEGSGVEHYRYMTEGAGAFHVGSSYVRLGRGSSFRSTSFGRGARIARNGLSVLLDAPGASCVLKGLYYTTGSEHVDNHIDVDHAGPGASSDQYFKGILDGSSKAVFSGRVLVRPNAQKTYARQADKNVVLSDGARINTKPSLEIYADDVQCFHGATAGAVAGDAIFYMRSRGMDEETARSLFVHGFASEIIDSIELPALRSHLDRMFSMGPPGAG